MYLNGRSPWLKPENILQPWGTGCKLSSLDIFFNADLMWTTQITKGKIVLNYLVELTKSIH